MYKAIKSISARKRQNNRMVIEKMKIMKTNKESCNISHTAYNDNNIPWKTNLYLFQNHVHFKREDIRLILPNDKAIV